MGRPVSEGMEVLFYPAGFDQQEYGYMKGTIESVDVYVTSREEMQKQLKDDTLADYFLQQGPVIEVICSINRDPDTASGYYWSGKKGRTAFVTEGIMTEARIITEKKSPASVLFSSVWN